MKGLLHRRQEGTGSQACERNSAERISQRILYGIVAVAVLVFGLFYLIGFDRPYIDDPNFNSPLFTNAVLLLMYGIVLAAVVVLGCAIYHTLKTRGRGERVDNGIPVKKIAYVVAIGTMVVLLLTFLLGSSVPMTVNGKVYADALWLKVADMFIFTSMGMILVAIGAVLYGATRYKRKEN